MPDIAFVFICELYRASAGGRGNRQSQTPNIANLKSQLPQPSTTNPQPALLRLTGAGGAIYYTLDGSDPRLRGGAVSAKAMKYTQPIEVKGEIKIKNTIKIKRESTNHEPPKIFARIRSEYGLWSAPLVWAY